MDIEVIAAIVSTVLTVILAVVGKKALQWRKKLVQVSDILNAVREATAEASPGGAKIVASEAVYVIKKIQDLLSE